jgi:hypothetical protein
MRSPVSQAASSEARNTNSRDGLIQSPSSPGHYEDMGTLIDKALCRSQSDTTGS